jgi:hypothetical protein
MNKSFVEKSLVAQIARLIGPTSLWSRDGKEAQRFRENMAKCVCPSCSAPVRC